MANTPRMMLSEQFRDQAISRLSDSGRRDQFEASIHRAYALASGYTAERAKIVGDNMLSDRGKARAISERATAAAREIVEATAAVRRAVGSGESRRVAIMRERPKPADLIEAIQRQEERAYVRGITQLPKRVEAAKAFPEAVLSAPRDLSNVPAEIYQAMHRTYLETTRGEELRSLDSLKSDAAEIAAFAQIALQGLKGDIGDKADETISTLYQKIDGV